MALPSGANNPSSSHATDADGRVLVALDNAGGTAPSDSAANATTPVSGQLEFNGTTWERQRGNTDGITLLASAAHTTGAVSATQTNQNAKGLLLVVDVTASGGAISLTPVLQSPDTVTGKNVTLWIAAAALIATGTAAYMFYPGIATGAFAGLTDRVNIALPRSWFFQMNVGNANSQTYTVAASVIL